MNEEILVDIGLSKNETKSFLALLELSAATSGQVADKAKLHRANAHDALERLCSKGLVSHWQRDKIRYYEAADPRNLLNLLKEKENSLETIMPQLQLLRQLALTRSHASIHEGVNALINILHGFLAYKEPILVYGVPRVAPEILKHVIPHFHNKRIAAKVPMLHIYNHNAQERIAYLNTLPHTEARYLPAQFDAQVATNICGDSIALVIYIQPVITILIKDQRIADAYKKYFDVLWNASKK